MSSVDEELLKAERLLTVDLVDPADAIYRRIAAAEPRNADAIVGMARCALARGDDHEAYRLAARAHAMDPGHDMARRMEARMAEILRTRGEVPGKGPGGTAPAPGATAPGKGSVDPVGRSGPSSSRSWLERLKGR
ncbi:MAG: hypothetical protein U0869_21170 [Chloroflexota bacterium]